MATKVNHYLNFPGNTEKAFNFYKSVFGGEFLNVTRFKDLPMEGIDLSEEDENKIMHISLPVGNAVLMATDAQESMGMKVIPGNNHYVSLHPDSKEEADRLFKGLSAGGEVDVEMADQSWGDYFGSFRDKFGVSWMINHEYPK